MLSFFLVKSPLQLLNAIEARHDYALNPQDCVLILMGDKKSQTQLQNMVRGGHGWGRVVALDEIQAGQLPEESRSQEVCASQERSKNSLGAIRALKSLAVNLGFVEYIFIGDYANELMRHFANHLTYKELIVLDDGNATIKYAELRRRKGDIWSQVRFSKVFKLRLKRLFLSLDDRPPPVVTFFTVYDIAVECNDRVRKNAYPYFRDMQKKTDSSNEVYFLGSPLVEAEILDDDEFFWHLEQVKEYFSADQLVYVAHRRENQAKLSRIEQECSIPVRHFDLPIEYQVAVEGPRPKLMSAFYSSALENCRMIFGGDMGIVAFKFDSAHFSKQESHKGAVVENVYEYYRKNANDAFRIIQLPIH